MLDAQLLPLRVSGELRILRELRQKRRLRRRHQPPVQGDAVEKADDALRHRAQIVQRLRLERDMAERLPPVLVGPVVIALQDRLAGLQRQNRVQSPQQARAKSRIEPLAEIAGESQAAQIRALGELGGHKLWSVLGHADRFRAWPYRVECYVNGWKAWASFSQDPAPGQAGSAGVAFAGLWHLSANMRHTGRIA